MHGQSVISHLHICLVNPWAEKFSEAISNLCPLVEVHSKLFQISLDQHPARCYKSLSNMCHVLRLMRFLPCILLQSIAQQRPLKPAPTSVLHIIAMKNILLSFCCHIHVASSIVFRFVWMCILMWNQCQFLTWKRWNIASSKNCPWPSHNHHLQYGLWRWRWCHLSRFCGRPPRCCGIALGKADWLPCCQSCYSERTPITVGRREKLWGIDIYTIDMM